MEGVWNEVWGVCMRRDKNPVEAKLPQVSDQMKGKDLG